MSAVLPAAVQLTQRPCQSVGSAHGPSGAKLRVLPPLFLP